MTFSSGPSLSLWTSSSAKYIQEDHGRYQGEAQSFLWLLRMQIRSAPSYITDQIYLANVITKFVDPLILMRVIWTESRRRIAFLIAEKSMRRRFIGAAARAVGAVSVGRALDLTSQASGRIYLPDPTNDPLLIRGVGTKFEKQAQVGGLVVLPTVDGTAANAEVQEILSDEEIRLKKEFRGDIAVRQLTGKPLDGRESMNGDLTKNHGFGGINFKVAPKVDQTKVYDAVFERLQAGGCVGIFPEGGSHDRTELLPLKGEFLCLCLPHAILTQYQPA